MKFKKALHFLFINLIIIIVFSSGCLQTKNSGDYIISDGRGDWGLPTPYGHYPRGPGYIRMSWIFDTLIWKDAKGYVPALATSWKYNKAKKSFIFSLNKKALWHDGKKLTAADVVFTIKYFKKHPYLWINLSHVSKAIAHNKHKVEIFMNKLYSPFLSDIAGTMPIIPKHIWQKCKNPKKAINKKYLTGSGPFTFEDFNRTKGTYLYKAFNQYYGGKPLAQRLIYIKANPIVSLITGKADLASIKPEMRKKLKKNNIKIIRDNYGWNKKLMINHNKKPLNNRIFRTALAHGINRQEIIDKAHRGFGKKASYGLLSSDHQWYNKRAANYVYNPQKSISLIKSLGYKMNKKGFFEKNGQVLQLTLLSSSITVAGETAADRDGEIIRNNLKAIGIKAKLIALEQTTLDTMVKKWDFDLALSGHGGILGDPKILNEMISLKYGAGSVNSARFDKNIELNRLFKAQLLEMNPGKRKKIVFKIQALYSYELPAISLYYPEGLAAYNRSKSIKWFFTKGGIAKGIPISQNKLSLVKRP
jgi:peptide/nickel transport system substrate-binding protein